MTTQPRQDITDYTEMISQINKFPLGLDNCLYLTIHLNLSGFCYISDLHNSSYQRKNDERKNEYTLNQVGLSFCMEFRMQGNWYPNSVFLNDQEKCFLFVSPKLEIRISKSFPGSKV